MGIIHTAKKYLAVELYKKLHRLHQENLSKTDITKKITRLDDAEVNITFFYLIFFIHGSFLDQEKGRKFSQEYKFEHGAAKI